MDLRRPNFPVYLLLFVHLLFATSLSAQDRMQLFLELGGFSKSYSGNISFSTHSNRSSEGYLRLGLGVEQDRLVLPLGFILLKGSRSHYVEISGGITLWSEGLRFWNRNRSDILLNINGGIAYRFQPYRQDYYISFGLFPFLRLDPSPNGIEAGQTSAGYRPGFSVGYRID